MSRTKPAMKFAGSLEVEIQAPLDARTVVPTKADLTIASNFPYAYKGLVVYVEEEEKLYSLTDLDTTIAANWKEVGSGGGGDVQWFIAKYDETSYLDLIDAINNKKHIIVDFGDEYGICTRAYVIDATVYLYTQLYELSDTLHGVQWLVDIEGWRQGEVSEDNTVRSQIDEQYKKILIWSTPTNLSGVPGSFELQRSDNGYTIREAGRTSEGSFESTVELTSKEYVDNAIEQAGGDPTIGKDITTNIDVGGLKSGTPIAATDTLASIIERMITTVYYPTYVAPSASLTYSVSALAKVGSLIEAKAGTVLYDAGAIMLQGTKQADRGGAATSFSIATNGAATDYSDTNDSGSFNIPALTRATKGNIAISGSVNYAQGPQPKDSNNEDYGTPLEAGSVNTSSKTIEFILPFYHGVNASNAISDLTGLTEDLSKKGQKTYSYSANNEYLYLAYDSAYGDLTSIKDDNNLENLGNFVKSTITHEGQTYRLYRSTYAITGSPKFIFIF